MLTTETTQDSFAPATIATPDIAARPAPENGAGGAAPEAAEDQGRWLSGVPALD